MQFSSFHKSINVELIEGKKSGEFITKEDTFKTSVCHMSEDINKVQSCEFKA